MNTAQGAWDQDVYHLAKIQWLVGIPAKDRYELIVMQLHDLKLQQRTNTCAYDTVLYEHSPESSKSTH